MKNLLIAAAVIAAHFCCHRWPLCRAGGQCRATGSSYDGAVVETHVGYASDLGDASSFYIQAGPAFLLPNDGDETTELSGKVGIKTEVTENLEAYGEVSAMTTGEMDFEEDLDLGVKLGLTYSF